MTALDLPTDTIRTFRALQRLFEATMLVGELHANMVSDLDSLHRQVDAGAPTSGPLCITSVEVLNAALLERNLARTDCVRIGIAEPSIEAVAAGYAFESMLPVDELRDAAVAIQRAVDADPDDKELQVLLADFVYALEGRP